MFNETDQKLFKLLNLKSMKKLLLLILAASLTAASVNAQDKKCDKTQCAAKCKDSKCDKNKDCKKSCDDKSTATTKKKSSKA
jgi:Ni/Co efflux regulator RcnB